MRAHQSILAFLGQGKNRLPTSHHQPEPVSANIQISTSIYKPRIKMTGLFFLKAFTHRKLLPDASSRSGL
jgi:hypothetical protein